MVLFREKTLSHSIIQCDKLSAHAFIFKGWFQVVCSREDDFVKVRKFMYIAHWRIQGVAKFLFDFMQIFLRRFNKILSWYP